jgi:hypothetical protein
MNGQQYPAELCNCAICQAETHHEIRRCDGALVRICLRCLKRAMAKFSQESECEGDVDAVTVR